MKNNSQTRTYRHFFPTLLTVISIAIILISIDVKAGNNYYFSSTSGDDSRTSTQAKNPSTPWKTIDKLNSYFSSLLAGDSVLLKRGEIFVGTITPTKSGTASNSIVIAAYGTGAKPVISGFSTVSLWASEGSGIYSKAMTAQSVPNMVTVDGVNTPIGRYPNSGYLTFESASGYSSITDNQLTATPNWTGAEAVIRKVPWIMDRCPITNHSGSTLSYTSPNTLNATAGSGYFIQNDTKCLDVFGEWAYKSGKLYMYFGTNNPNSYLIKVSVVNRLINITGDYDYLSFMNLSLDGANKEAIYINYGDFISISNCGINYSGSTAVMTGNSDPTNILIENTTINHSNNNGILLSDFSHNSIVRGSTIKNTGLIPGMGNSGGMTYMGVNVRGNNCLVEYNEIDSTGYSAVIFQGYNSKIKNNYINYYCTVLDDGSGIYTASDIHTGRVISDNIVLNGIGAGAGTAEGLNSANGIYLDNDAAFIEISGNSVSKNVYSGIYLHNAHDNNIHDNTVFDNNIQLILGHDNSGSSDPIRNILLTGNIFANKNSTQVLISQSSNVNDLVLFGTASGNYYINPYGDDAVSIAHYYNSSGKYYLAGYTFDFWKASYDSQAKTFSKMPKYIVNSHGANKFSNGSFLTTIAGISSNYSGGITSAWSNSSGLDAGNLSVTPTSLSTSYNDINNRVTGLGAIENSKKYILKYSCLGVTEGSVNVHLRQSSSPYGYSTPIQYYKVKNSRSETELLLSPTINDSNGWAYLVQNDANGTTRFDNIELYEANVTIMNPDDYIRFEYNASSITKTIVLENSYLGVDSTVYSGNLTLQPYKSIILIKSGLASINHNPVISNQSFQATENSSNNYIVGTVLASDPDAGQSISYSIASGNINGAFAINASTGLLTVANSAAVNFESTPTFALVVKTQDNGTGNLSAQATITVSLLDVNEAPVIANQSFAVAENSANGLIVGSVIALDPDAGQIKTFSIISGNTSGAFSINATSGQLTIANEVALNFESNPTFSLMVKVADNGTGNLSSQATVTVTLLDVNEAPAIANQSFAVAENSANGSIVGSVIALDPDAGQIKTFSIISGNTGGAFLINATSGQLTSANTVALNFESTPTFSLIVKVADNGTGNLSSQATVTVSLLDVNEAPVIANQSFAVAENSANGSIVGSVIVLDPDAGQIITFSIISGNASGAFAINAASGQLTIANTAALNFESTPTFSLIVKVADNGTGNLSSQATVTVSLLDVNEAPVIANQSFTVAENSTSGSTVGTVIASDPDAVQTLTFSILSGNTNEAFTINAISGLLTVSNSAVIDFELNPTFILTVKVQDNGNLSSQNSVIVSLLNINESPVVLSQTFTLIENSVVGTVAGMVIATNPDPSQILTYTIISGNTSNAFAINPLNGTLTVANSSAINIAVNPSFAIIVKVENNGTGLNSSQATITINILNANVCTATGYISYQVWNNIGNGETVYSLTSNINYPNTPTSSTLISSMEGTTNLADNFGARIAGYICAPASGNYTFWIASDDNCELWLSTNDLAANKQKIAFHTSWTNPRDWNKFASQKSVPLNLVQGQRYYIEALMKDGGGSDNLAVGWLKPSQTGSVPSEVIPGSVLSPIGTNQNVLVTSVSLPTTININTGSSVLIPATVLPGNVLNNTLTWTSSNVLLATVGNNGLVAGVAPGIVTITATSTDGSNKSGSCQATVNSQNSQTCTATGYVSYQVWNNIGNVETVYSLTSNINYPNTPTSSTLISSMEGTTNLADNFGARLAGYICAPASGNYTFWIASDDNCELWLSTNDLPANKQKIAFHTSWTNPRDWSKFASQKSASINLIQGQRYYIEALMKDGGGSDNLAVGWLKPGQTGSVPSEVIPGSVLSPIGTSQNVLVTSVNLPATIAINSGSNMLIQATVLPGNASNNALVWTSSNVLTATVGNNGLVTGVAPGIVTITATTTDGSNKSGSCQATVNPVNSQACTATGYVSYQVWNNIGNGETVYSLTSNINYPNTPTTSTLITSMEGTTNLADNFGARLAGYICAPASGNYTFWIASDDNCELWLSTNDLPANKQQIAFHTSWTNPRDWSKFASQKSASINLIQGQRYYIEALMKDGGGSDNLAVGWLKPGQTGSVPSEVIPGSVLSPIGTSQNVLVTSVNLPATIAINSGSNMLIQATVLPGNASNKALVWTSSNVLIATVGTNGLVTGVAAGIVTITAMSTDGSNKSGSCQATVNSQACTATGYVSYQVWNNIGNGETVYSLTSNINYPNTPSTSTLITSMEGTTNLADNFGARLAGYICAPASGNYTFWIASDDNCELWLSTNDLPANKQKIAFHTSWTNPRDWSKFASQKSSSINLIQGQRYYIEALMKDGGGSDNLAVGWLKPGQTGTVPSEVIPGSVLSPLEAKSNEVISINPSSSLSEPQLSVYPNPLKFDNLNIKVEFLQSDATLKIYSVMGVECYDCKIQNSGTLQIDRSVFKSGIYIINLYNDSFIKSTKLIVN